MTPLRRRGQYELARPVVRSAGTVDAPARPKDRHNARLLVVSAGGAIVVEVSLLYTARSYRLSHRGQVTDRFTKALERLSSNDLGARLGGIHALAHVANDSRPHHDDVVEVLEAFLRRRAPKAARHDDGPSLAPRPVLPERPAADVQAALTALGRRPHRPERRILDLSNLHLANARLADLALRGADLRGAYLRDAVLQNADLRGANLRGANLQRATLAHANLRRAYLRDANLCCAYLRGAYLRGADLWHANLWDANLRAIAGLSEEIRASADVFRKTRF